MHSHEPIGATIRPARPTDEPALYDICLRTGSHGKDASTVHDDPRLLGEVYVGPYLAFAPELAFVLAGPDDVVLGYVLGVADTRAFETWCELAWWPPLRRRHPVGSGRRPADAALVQLIHAPPRAPTEVVDPFPAHLHVDLLPRAQGGGNGRRLLDRLFEALRESGVPGVHLGVSARNPRAIGFYQHLGFATLDADEQGARLGLRLG